MPGCFTHEGGVTITKGQLFLWELIMTFVLVSTVYAVAVTRPGHGNIGPLAVGFSLFASAFIGRQHHAFAYRVGLCICACQKQLSACTAQGTPQANTALHQAAQQHNITMGTTSTCITIRFFS